MFHIILTLSLAVGVFKLQPTLAELSKKIIKKCRQYQLIFFDINANNNSWQLLKGNIRIYVWNHINFCVPVQ
jgi:hypothetical protein